MPFTKTYFGFIRVIFNITSACLEASGERTLYNNSHLNIIETTGIFLVQLMFHMLLRQIYKSAASFRFVFIKQNTGIYFIIVGGDLYTGRPKIMSAVCDHEARGDLARFRPSGENLLRINQYL